MDIIGIKEQKKQLRREIKAVVSSLPESYCNMADLAVFQNICSLPEYEEACTVFCFVGRKDEIDTIPIIRDALQRGKKAGVPKCVAKGIMEVYQIDSLKQLQPGNYGIMEPGPDTEKMQPEDIDLAIIPCVTCSKDGWRLGYGGGYYDRYLELSDMKRAVICRERIIRAWIPVEEHDRQMDLVISEAGVCRIRKIL